MRRSNGARPTIWPPSHRTSFQALGARFATDLATLFRSISKGDSPEQFDSGRITGLTAPPTLMRRESRKDEILLIQNRGSKGYEQARAYRPGCGSRRAEQGGCAKSGRGGI
ncbi:hypothetical protein SPHINGOAX6_70554 [Sphingomonas sp. AX6]|nr:hypothetical protein SPHINGOAX6_70554 [Sphingomonas sp. AX6]